jgi:hypothetical protein
VVGVAELGDRQEERLRAGAVEEGDAAAGGVGAGVVHVQEEGRVGWDRVAGEDLGRYGRENATAGGVVGGVVRWNLGGGVRRDGEVLAQEVAGAEGGGLGTGRADRDVRSGGDVAVDSTVEGQVDEGDALEGVVVGEGQELDGVGAPLVAEVVDAGLPADHVHNVLNDHVDRVRVKGVVGRRV